MFSVNAPVSESVIQSVLAYRETRYGLSSSVASEKLMFLEGIPPLRSVHSNSYTENGLPHFSLVSTPEDARRAYPEPPAELLKQDDNIATQKQSHPSPKETTRDTRRRRVELTHPTLTSRSQDDDKSSQVPVMHFEDGYETVDYLGRTFIEPPVSLHQQMPQYLSKPCQPPRLLKGVFKGKQTAADGIQQVLWGPPAYGHLLFSADLAGVAQLWEAHGGRRLIATYNAHKRPIKSLETTSNASVVSTGSVDGTVAMWDVEEGVCKAVITNAEGLAVVQHRHHPTNEDSLLLAALDKKVALYDVRASNERYQREYTGHMGTIFNLTLLSDGGKMLTTSEDKTLRTWDFRIPVQIKQFADAGMHAITHVVHHPTEEFIAAQSLDNKVIVFKDEGAGKLKLHRHTEFTGHNISGSRCQLAFSRDGQYLSSGDITGKFFVWQWSTRELVKSFQAHSQMLVSHVWHPLESSRVVTAAWDGCIKNWA